MAESKTRQNIIFIRDVPPSIKDSFLALCRKKGHTMRWTIIKLIEKYIKEQKHYTPDKEI